VASIDRRECVRIARACPCRVELIDWTFEGSVASKSLPSPKASLSPESCVFLRVKRTPPTLAHAERPGRQAPTRGYQWATSNRPLTHLHHAKAHKITTRQAADRCIGGSHSLHALRARSAAAAPLSRMPALLPKQPRRGTDPRTHSSAGECSFSILLVLRAAQQ